MSHHQPTKAALARQGHDLVVQFCHLNGFPPPAIFYPTRDHPEKMMRAYYKTDACGFYRFQCTYHRAPAIFVMVDKCASVGLAGRCWSWPGYPVDRTPYGVHCHELGHYLDCRQGDFESVGIRRDSGEDSLTGYGPNTAEWYAEMVKLYLTNPDLLRLLRPKTYQQLRERYEPVVTQSWEQVLRKAPERTRTAAARRIQKGR